jgi:hypothetical protein
MNPLARTPTHTLTQFLTKSRSESVSFHFHTRSKIKIKIRIKNLRIAPFCLNLTPDTWHLTPETTT